jgi:hypothetical protein
MIHLSLRSGTLGFRNTDLETSIWISVAFSTNTSIDVTFLCTYINSTSTTGTIGSAFLSNLVLQASTSAGTVDHSQDQSNKNKKSCFHCIGSIERMFKMILNEKKPLPFLYIF